MGEMTNEGASLSAGIDLSQFTFNAQPDGYLAFLGRVSKEKGLAKAIGIARKVGLPLKVAARMPLPNVSDARVREDWDYWRDEIEPLLGSDVDRSD